MKQTLIKLGISPKAADIYLDLLQKGSSSVDQLSKSTGIKRTSIYPYITELKNFNLVKWDEHHLNQAIKACDPEAIQQIAKEKLGQIQILRQETANLIPDLKAMYQVSDPSYTVFKFTGISACRQALERVYDCPIQYGYCGEFVYDDLGSDWYKDHLNKMYKQKHINDHVIFSKDAIASISYPELLKTSWFDPQFAHYQIHPNLHLPQGIDGYILDKEVITLFSEPELTCVIINSQKYRDYQLSIFQALWVSSIDIQKGTI